MCLSLVSGLLSFFLPATSANAATGSADLTVSGSVSPDPATEGDTITYLFSVHNEGPDPAEGTTLTSELSPDVRLDSASSTTGSCAGDPIVTCDLGTLDAGPNDARVTIVVKAGDVDADAFIVTHAAVTASTEDPDETNNELDVMSSVLALASDGADLELTSVANQPNPVTGGYDLGSTVIVTNLGPGGATEVTLTDTLASGESFVAEGSDPSCTASDGVVSCALGDVASGDAATLLIVTTTPKVDADGSIDDVFAVTAPEDASPANDRLEVVTEVLAPRDDFVAGYVHASDSVTWLTDATRWSHGDPVATAADPTVAAVGIPGGGPGGPVSITERACGTPFACMAPRRSNGGFPHMPRGVFGALVQVSAPDGYGASNPILGAFWDDWSVLRGSWGRFEVSYQAGSAATPTTLSYCGRRTHVGPPCVASIGRSSSWWHRHTFGDLRTFVRFTESGTFGRGR
jgi:uncharacterized repeat protein (TIGR01451 family)